MKQYIFLDTNIWIFLTNGRNPYNLRSEKRDFDTNLHMTVFEELKKAVAKGDLEVLINKQIEKEITRNQKSLEEQIGKIEKKKSDVAKYKFIRILYFYINVFIEQSSRNGSPFLSQ